MRIEFLIVVAVASTLLPACSDSSTGPNGNAADPLDLAEIVGLYKLTEYESRRMPTFHSRDPFTGCDTYIVAGRLEVTSDQEAHFSDVFFVECDDSTHELTETAWTRSFGLHGDSIHVFQDQNVALIELTASYDPRGLLLFFRTAPGLGGLARVYARE